MSRKIILVSLFVLLFPLLYARFNLVNVQANNGYTVHNLDSNLNYTTIQEAIDANETDDGHTILVDADIYYEHVIVNKSISLVGQERSTTIIDGSVNRTVVTITKDNVNVTGFTIQNSGDYPERGFYLDNVSRCHITGNDMTNNSAGMRIWNSSNNNTISGNNITNNRAGIYLAGSSNNITGNNMLDNYYSISLYDSSTDNIVSGNNMANRGYGISLYPYSSNNTISGNNITSYFGGIYLDRASNNRFYHNNVMDNIDHVILDVFSNNVWDNGAEGNYWSDYTGVDSDHDGIGDSQFEIDEDNIDHYPLMGMFSDFNTSLGDVYTICNSTVSAFQFNGTAISFNVTGKDDTDGFCRICIPQALIGGTYRVFVNDTEILPAPEPLPCSNMTHTYLYFGYRHSTQEVIVIPEFPSFLILPLFMSVTLLAVAIYRKEHSPPVIS